MADYKDLASRLVLDAIVNKIPGLNIKVNFFFYASEGEYDPESDTTNPVYTTIPNVVCVKSKPTARDTADFGVQWNETKLLVPGLSMPQTPGWEPNPDADYVIMGGLKYGMSKVVGTPGDPLWIIFVKRT